MWKVPDSDRKSESTWWSFKRCFRWINGWRWKTPLQNAVFQTCIINHKIFLSFCNVWRNICLSVDLLSLFSTSQVSKAAADLMAYCDAHIREDPLIVPVPASENPFREKKFFCTILWWPAGRAVQVQAWRCLASLSSPHLKLLAISVEFCQVDILLLVSSVLVAEGFGGVSYQTGNPVSVSCLVK